MNRHFNLSIKLRKIAHTPVHASSACVTTPLSTKDSYLLFYKANHCTFLSLVKMGTTMLNWPDQFLAKVETVDDMVAAFSDEDRCRRILKRWFGRMAELAPPADICVRAPYATAPWARNTGHAPGCINVQPPPVDFNSQRRRERLFTQRNCR